jgi:hypothetical protein
VESVGEQVGRLLRHLCRPPVADSCTEPRAWARIKNAAPPLGNFSLPLPVGRSCRPTCTGCQRPRAQREMLVAKSTRAYSTRPVCGMLAHSSVHRGPCATAARSRKADQQEVLATANHAERTGLRYRRQCHPARTVRIIQHRHFADLEDPLNRGVARILLSYGPGRPRAWQHDKHLRLVETHIIRTYSRPRRPSRFLASRLLAEPGTKLRSERGNERREVAVATQDRLILSTATKGVGRLVVLRAFPQRCVMQRQSVAVAVGLGQGTMFSSPGHPIQPAESVYSQDSGLWFGCACAQSRFNRDRLGPSSGWLVS